uniref:NAD(P)-binding protein n=1 Tax=Syphacia muris TaxID=451379 RepID=A0A0N5ADI6_9BILA
MSLETDEDIREVQVHKSPVKRQFNSRTNAMDIVNNIDLSDKTVLITGSNSGIGIETARTLALKGAHVIMANRNIAETEKIRDKIVSEKPDAYVDYVHIDLSSLASVKKAAEEYLVKDWPLNILILNAGVFSPSEKTTKDGYETTFGVNHLGHFYLTYLLLDRLRQSAPSRIVIVASISHNHSGVCFLTSENSLSRISIHSTLPTDEKIRLLTEPSLSLMPYRLYACSKLCNILAANKLHRSEFANGIRVYSVHPGTLIFTGISRTYGWAGKIFYFLFRPLCKTLQQGAATTVYCAASDDVLEKSGRYFSDCWDDEQSLAKALVDDQNLQDGLWNKSVELIKNFEANQKL